MLYNILSIEDKYLKRIEKIMQSFFRKNRSFILFLGVFIFVRSTFANQYVVPSGSMLPTISIGDRIFVNRMAYDLKVPFSNVIVKHTGEPKRGQIVVFESPKEKGLVLVKRLIAVPGDEVEIKNGFVFLNGKQTAEATEIQESYYETIGEHRHVVQRIPEYFRPDHFHFIVPEGKYFMMGDNRDNSADGRVFGLVSRELLIGEATRVLFSVDFNQPVAHMLAVDRFGKALL
jgi:signal peptidase I